MLHLQGALTCSAIAVYDNNIDDACSAVLCSLAYICMQAVGVSFSSRHNRLESTIANGPESNENYLQESKVQAQAAESILAASPNGLPHVANQCKSSTNALYQEVDSRTLTTNVMAMA